jgi:MYXO-CTERM domain-containing protein
MVRGWSRAGLALGLWVAAAQAWGRPDVVAPHPALADGLRQAWNRRLHVKEDLRARLPVVIKLAPGVSPGALATLETQGVVFERVDGVVARVGPYVGASLDGYGLRKVLETPFVQRVFHAPRGVPPAAPGNPFGKTWQWTNVEQVWPRRMTADVRTQGAGVVLCDLDGAMDVFHPLFFRPDGGLYAWLDVNGNGRLDPGVDGVDLDGNGVGGLQEQLRVVGGELADATGMVPGATAFHPARHFLYADSNQNTVRDVGRAAGFTEQTPAYGEPLFVADDVNNNGVVDVGEKLIRLATAKIKGVYRPSTGLAYERGTNLIDVPILTDASHGSGVAGILVGGVHGVTWVQGLAPQADLLGVVQDAASGELGFESPEFQANRIASLAWANNHGTRIFVHEYGQATGEFADGSSDWEGVLDQLHAQGTVQATAAHNFAGNNGRARLQLAPGQAVDLPVMMLDYPAFGYSILTLRGNFRWRGAVGDIGVTLRTVGNVTLDGTTSAQVGQDIMFGLGAVSSRGTGMVDFTYARTDAAQTEYVPVPVGAYNLHVVNNAAQPREVFTYVTDDTSYAFFVDLQTTHDDASSMAHPSTADSALVVGAFRVNTLDRGETEGDLAYYSGRGPRIDGVTTVAVASPADQYTAAAVGSHYQVFDGTSGALPQVAGALALLLQKEPALTPAQVKLRVASNSRVDASTGVVPNHQWGAGRLDVPLLLYGMDFGPNNPPQLVVNAPLSTVVNALATLDVSATTDDHDSPGQLSFRFDVDYNGTWDATGAAANVLVDRLGPLLVLVEAEDTQGSVSRRLVTLTGVPAGGGSSSSGSGASTSHAGTSSSLTVSSAGSVGSSSSSPSSTSLSLASSNPGTSTSAAPGSSSAVAQSSSARPASSAASSSSAATSTAVSAASSSSSIALSSSSSSLSGSSVGTSVPSSSSNSSSLAVGSSALSMVPNSSSASGASSSPGAEPQPPRGGCGNCAQTDAGGALGLLVLGWLVRRRRVWR